MQFDRFLSVLEQKWLENQEIYYIEAAHLVYHLFTIFKKNGELIMHTIARNDLTTFFWFLLKLLPRSIQYHRCLRCDRSKSTFGLL